MLRYEITPTLYKKNESDAVGLAYHVDQARGLVVLVKAFFGPSLAPKYAELARSKIVNYLTHESFQDDATLPFVLKTFQSLKSNLIFNAFVLANRAIYDENQRLPFHERGLISAAVGMVAHTTICIGTVGDSGLAQELESETRLLLRSENLENFSLQEDSSIMSIPLNGLGVWQDFEPQIREYKASTQSRFNLFTGKGIKKNSTEPDVHAEIRFLRG